MRLVALALMLSAAVACGPSDARPVALSTVTTVAPSPVVAGERDPLPTRERLVPTTRASRSLVGERSHPRAAVRQPTTGAAPAAGPGRVVSSTAYCETGTMANGQRTYDGAVAMNGVPMGSRWHVLSGPYAGRVLTVADRIGHSSQFDIAIPGRCQAALDYGRRQITIERVS